MIIEASNALGIDLTIDLANNISKSIYLRMSGIMDWELLYMEVNDNINYLKELINKHLPYILAKIIKYKYKLGKDFLEGKKDSLSNTATNQSLQEYGYKGFGIDNQAGKFSNNDYENTTTQTDFISFVALLGEDLETWSDRIFFDIKNNLCVTIL